VQNEKKRLSFFEKIDNFEMWSGSGLISRIRLATIITSIILICFGFSVACGWIFDNQHLYRYVADTQSMVFNTAIIFITFAVVGLAIIFEKKYVVICGLVFILVMSIISAAEIIFSINLYIDEMFVVNKDPLDAAYPGRMSLLTATLNIIASISFLFLYYFRTNIIISSAAAAFVLLVSTSGLIGYAFNISTLYTWLSPVAISIPAAIGFIILSALLCMLNAYFYLSKKISLYRQLPLLIGLSFCILSLYLFIALRKNEVVYGLHTNYPIIVLISGLLVSFVFFTILQLLVKKQFYYKQSESVIAMLYATLEASSDAIIVFSLKGNVLTFNKKFLKLWTIDKLGLDSYSINNFHDILKANVLDAPDLLERLGSVILKIDDFFDIVINLKNSLKFKMLITPYVLNNLVAGAVYSFRDITNETLLAEQLEHQSMYDTLTNYPNRVLSAELVAQAISDVKSTDNIIAVYYLDVDNFSGINALFGRSIGDAVFKDIMDQVAKSVSHKITLGRMTGDEFIVIAKELNSTAASSVVLTSIQSVFLRSFPVGNKEISISCCIGIAIFPFDGEDSETIMQHADTALRQAKNIGRGVVRFYSKEMNTLTQERIALEALLRKAILEDDFIVHYQPIMDLKLNIPCGLEALVRMPGVNGELIPPDSFIKLAEDMGIISQLGKMVMLTACKQLKTWHDLGKKNIYISVNVSAHQLQSGILLQTVSEVLTVTGLDPNSLVLEITESVLINISEELIFSLRGIASLGVKFAMDDFGTGYSSFSYAKELPFSILKIDRSLVVDAAKSERDTAIAKTIIMMCKNLNYNVLAEGVDNKAQADLFISLECDSAQGFYFSKPLSAKDCTIYLQSFN
jgi:diguanylate cyclase (GGDEF)-like protein